MGYLNDIMVEGEGEGEGKGGGGREGGRGRERALGGREGLDLVINFRE